MKVQSIVDGSEQSRDVADGSEERSKVRSKLLPVDELTVGPAPATSTATAILDSESVFPTCTPLPITDQYDSTLQEHSTCSAARSKDMFHETPLLLLTSGKGPGQ